jgi:hypothetical protein
VLRGCHVLPPDGLQKGVSLLGRQVRQGLVQSGDSGVFAYGIVNCYITHDDSSSSKRSVPWLGCGRFSFYYGLPRRGASSGTTLAGRSRSSICPWMISTTRHARSRMASDSAARSSATLCGVAQGCADGAGPGSIAFRSGKEGVSAIGASPFESRPPRSEQLVFGSIGDSVPPQSRTDPEPTEAEIEAAIVRAMLDGRGAVAEALAAALKARRAAAAGNVVELGRRRK